MKCRTTPICLILVLVLVLGLCPVTGASAQGGDLTAEKDSSSSYKPTEIVNGGFETPYQNETAGVVYGIASKRIGTDKGWNTTDTWAETSSTISSYGVQQPTTGSYFAEMNAATAAILYQDLTTHGGDVIRWTLDHAARNIGDDPQAMEVQIGASDGNDPSGRGAGNLNSHIDDSTKALYQSTGVTNPSGKTYGFGNADELKNLSVPQLSSNNPWYNAKGIYLVPEGQSVTRFAFVSLCSNAGLGNLLDNITFSTLIGNLSITLDSDGDAVVKGYWGDTDASKSLVIKIGSKTYEVDMSAVCPGNFSITIPADMLGSADKITVYHEDYSSASRSVFLHEHTLVYEASGATLSVYCNNSTVADRCGIQGKENKVSITVSAQSKEYDGTPVIATLSDTTDWEGVLEEVPTIEYYKESSTSGNSLMKLLFATAFAEEKLDSAPSDVGNYTARISAGDATAKVAFSITKQAADAPTGLVGVPPTSSKAEDGYIDGVDDTMEYSTDGGQTWTPVPEETTTLTDLGEGSYWVRYKETDTVEASDPVKLDLKAKSPADAVPKTGDNSNIMLYAAALLLSTICAFILLQRKRSR